MLSEDDKRFFALYLKQCNHRAKFPSSASQDIEAKYERRFEVKNRLMRETRDLVRKWDKTGLLDGIKNDVQPSKMAVILESKPCMIMEDGTKIVTDD